MTSLQILGPFTNCYHTCNTNDPSFVIGGCEVRFVVLVFDHSVTTYSALDGTHVLTWPSSVNTWNTEGQWKHFPCSHGFLLIACCHPACLPVCWPLERLISLCRVVSGNVRSEVRGQTLWLPDYSGNCPKSQGCVQKLFPWEVSKETQTTP